MARYGVPDEVVTNRGAQFTGEMWKEMLTSMGTHHSPTTAFHPQANGLVERMHRHLKVALRARLDGPE